MPIYESTIAIGAPASLVWQILSAIDRYGEWNPQIPKASGKAEEGTTIQMTLALPGRPSMNVSANVEEATPDRLLTWRGNVGAPWLFSGFRKFEIVPSEDGKVLVTHIEDIGGLLSPVFGLLMGGPVRKSQKAVNEALRERAESG